MRETKLVPECPNLKGSHWHLFTEDNERCGATGQWLKEPTYKSYKQIKEQWFPRKD